MKYYNIIIYFLIGFIEAFTKGIALIKYVHWLKEIIYFEKMFYFIEMHFISTK